MTKANVHFEPNDWATIERCLVEAHKSVETASTEEQFQSVGLLCREALISLAQIVYNPQLHSSIDGVMPSETDAKRKLDIYLAVELTGSSNEAIRRQIKAAIDLANELQHKRTANHRDSALCLEATGGAINLIRIIAGQPSQMASTDVKVEFSYKSIQRTSQEHIYRLEVAVVNQGKQAINNFKLEFTFPDLDSIPRKWILLTRPNEKGDPLINIEPGDQTVSIIREGSMIRVAYRSKDILFSQDRLNLGDKIGLKYHINQDVYANINDMPLIRWTFYADNLRPKEGEISLANLNNY